ncbi:hypothetical protein [Mucilaginibacter pocheonensis]|uniref:DUF4468 domain-containing protein n=1 Tax=Mucilaginibacter pocheonensis TaxID=398050 RepID=A0ABU1TF14_9SPHI|nr:hypothetical protein [Mucilaginibacter pocheonensis]MDR6943790.1 hypothetical protein [Mucilaginibacter pocheonensis]
MTNLHQLPKLSLFLLILFSCGGRIYAQNLQQFQSKVQSLSSKKNHIKFGEQDTLIYLNEVDINISSKETIYIENYGYINGRRKINFFSNNPFIVVRSSMNGKDSLLVPIENKSVAQGVESLMDFPTLKDMPDEYADLMISDLKKFDQKLMGQIKANFGIGKHTVEQGGQITRITAYTDLKIKSQNLLGQIALFISLPFTINGQTYCHVSYKAREKRLFSDNWRDPESEVQKAAKDFFLTFFKHL